MQKWSDSRGGIEYDLAQGFFPRIAPPILCQTVGFEDCIGIAVKDTEVTMSTVMGQSLGMLCWVPTKCKSQG